MIASERDSLICQYHPMGWTDTMIAEKAGVSLRTLTDSRKRLGLASNRFGRHARPNIVRGVRSKLAEMGYRSLQCVRRARTLIGTEKDGWPVGTSAREGSILEMVYRSGPLPVRSIAAMAKLSGYSNGHCWAAVVVRKLVREGVMVRCDCRRGRDWLYDLSKPTRDRKVARTEWDR